MKKMIMASMLVLGMLTLQASEIEKEQVSSEQVKPYYMGEIVKVEQGGAYTYLEIKEKNNKSFWIAVNSIEANKGDTVRFQNELVVKDFTSKALNKKFDELMFASNLQYKVK